MLELAIATANRQSTAHRRWAVGDPTLSLKRLFPIDVNLP